VRLKLHRKKKEDSHEEILREFSEGLQSVFMNHRERLKESRENGGFFFFLIAQDD